MLATRASAPRVTAILVALTTFCLGQETRSAPAGGKAAEARKLSQQGYFTRAIALYRDAIALDPDLADAHDGLISATRQAADKTGGKSAAEAAIQKLETQYEEWAR